MQPQLLTLLRQHHRLSDLAIWLGVGLIFLLKWIPLPVMYVLACLLGEICFWLHRYRRRITLRNLSACFPELSRRQIRRLGRRHFHFLLYTLLTTGINWWASGKRLERLTRIRNASVVETLRKNGENIIFLAPHFVALEYGGIYLASRQPIMSIYKKHKNPLLDELIRQHRLRFGGKGYGHKESGKSLIRQIQAGLPFYYPPDQNSSRNRVFAPFFSIPTATFPTLGRIAALGNARVVPCCTRILAWGKGYEIIFLPALTSYPQGDELTDTTTMNRVIEQLIKYAPEQYLWCHRRFKTRPPGEKPFYRY